MAGRPLEGIRIMDQSVMTAGPWGVQILADLGAEVIKTERPGRAFDVNRINGPHQFNTTYYYMCMNKDKKCIQLDFNQPGHKDLYKKIVEKCDLVTENFKAGSMDRLGLGYKDLKEVKSDIVYSAVSGYGQTGPCSPLPASDLVIQATSGFMSVNGDVGSTGMKAGSSLADVYASVVGAVALMGGLYHKLETGEGTLVDTSMQCADMSMTAYEMAKYLNTGIVTRPNGNADQEVGFCETVNVADGLLMVDASKDEDFAAFVKVIGHEEFAADERFATGESRFANRQIIADAANEVTANMAMAELAAKCRAAGVPVGEVNTINQALANRYLEDNDMVSMVYDEKFGYCKTVDLPIHFDKFEIPKYRTSGQAGADTAEVLKDLLGLSDEEIKELYSYEGAVEV